MAQRTKFATFQIETRSGRAAEIEERLQAASELLNEDALSAMGDLANAELAPAAGLIRALLDAHLKGALLPSAARDAMKQFTNAFHAAGLCGSCGQGQRQEKEARKLTRVA